MRHVHFLQDRHTVIGDNHFSLAADQHRIEPLGTKGALYRRANRAYSARIIQQRRISVVSLGRDRFDLAHLYHRSNTKVMSLDKWSSRLITLA